MSRVAATGDDRLSGDIGLINLRWAQALVDGLAAAGLRELILSPGSRSSPLALAFLRQPAIRCRVVLDERSAAFVALGIARVSGRPAAVLCTSGSAPANWFPAVVEADLSDVPMLLLSADRPPELLGWGANQTIDQQRLFGHHVRAFHAPPLPAAGFSAAYLRRLAARALAESGAPLPGPVHLNIAFREPLLPAGDLLLGHAAAAPAAAVTVAAPLRQPLPSAIASTLAEISGRAGVIVCGGADYPPAFADGVAALAERLDCPIFAEAPSNLRFGSHDRSRHCVRYEGFLRRPSRLAAARPEWLLRFGAFPVSRTLQDWLHAAAPAAEIVVSAGGRWPDPQHAATRLIHADPAAVCAALVAGGCKPAPAAWRAAFAHAEAVVERLAAAPGDDGDLVGALIPALLAVLPADHRVFCGNSLAIRDLDVFSGGADKRLRILANRGASGIDGNLSTALGIASAGPCLALVGDLTAQHDLTALAAAAHAGADLVVLVLNNGGGGIFDHLPVACLPEFERGWLTPQNVDLVAAAAALGVAGERVASLPAFVVSLQRALRRGGATLLEVVVDRQATIAGRQRFWRRVAAALA